MENKLYYGDNLDILKRYVEDESVDLVYLDPLFSVKYFSLPVASTENVTEHILPESNPG